MTKLLGVLVVASLGLLGAAAQATEVGVSIEVSQPGVYGRVDIGRFPQPVIVRQTPVIITQPAVVVAQPQPVYMWVPPGHRRKWHKHCHKYGACGAPVYFVQDNWYRQHVMVEARSRGDDDFERGHDRGKGHGKGHKKGKD